LRRLTSGNWPEEITYSEAGITVREAKDLWKHAGAFPRFVAAALNGVVAAATLGGCMSRLLFSFLLNRIPSFPPPPTM